VIATPEDLQGATLLTDLLTLREVTPDRWAADALAPNRHNGLYGGQVAAQALVAAARTVAGERLPHSLHGYFLRRGDAREPVTFDVERDRDGHSYSARTVVARQDDRVIFRMSASFARPEEGPDRQAAVAPAVRTPEESQELPAILPGVRVRDPEPSADRAHPMRTWVVAPGAGEGDAVHQAAVLVYVSDLFSGLAHLMGPRVRAMASLDHAVWFHRPVRMDDWVLMDNVGTTLAAARGWYSGTLYDRSGAALASIAQEMVIREARGPEDG
jgi:acyl-CoA thioesterase-2